MNLVAINIDSLPFGRPLPYSLRAADGTLLASRGYVIHSRTEVQALLTQGVGLCMDTDESDDSHRSYVGQLQQMVFEGAPLGQIAEMRIDMARKAGLSAAAGEPPDWPDLQQCATRILYAPHPPEFTGRLRSLIETLAAQCRHRPDATLFALTWLSGQEVVQYSATHAMLVSCVCMLVARETLQWPEARQLQLGSAALSMNIAMARLQDELTHQAEPLTLEQLHAVQHHAERSEQLLREAGVTDPAWLEAVRHHHQRTKGPLEEQSLARQMARLIQLADTFSARIAPRTGRPAQPVTAAIRTSYYDEQRQVDEAGAALLRTLGVYPPGTFVRLASKEVAVALRRGAAASTPRVAVVIGRSGTPTGEPIPRDTSQAAYRITAPVPPHEVRVRMPLQRLLALV